MRVPSPSAPTGTVPTRASTVQQFHAAFTVGRPSTGGMIGSGYSDLAPGTDVTVRNEKGDIIAIGDLEVGQWERRACRLSFTVSDVPSARFYEIEVGRRGAQRYSSEHVEAPGFRVDLTLN